MDCSNALAKLELCRSEACAEDDPELTAASAHLADCARCRTLVANREEMDRAIAAVCRDVPVPAGLENRLLDAVQAELASNSVPAPDDKPHRSKSPRRFRQISVIAASLLCLMFGGWYWIDYSTVSLNKVTQAASQQLDSQVAGPLFSGAFEPQQSAPTAAMDFSSLSWMDDYRELFPQRTSLDIAISEFEFRSNGGRTIRGALIIAPAAKIWSSPTATSMSSATPIYHSRFSAVSWRDGDFVYVCIVQGGDAPLRELQRQDRQQTT